MKPRIYLQPLRAEARFNRVELARMFWRAAYYVRRQRPEDEYTPELLAYLEREFRTMWGRPGAIGHKGHP
jgi:hypothetical protein